MKNWIIAVTCLNIMFLFMHEFDASHRGEWRMMRFIRKFEDTTQYLLFLYAHIPLTLFCFYYLWSTMHFINYPLWLGMNIFSVFHLILHIAALRWKSNVFSGLHSFLFITGYGVTGGMNLILAHGYIRV